ncbi:MAG: hypothetical protein ACE5H2_09155, partial [Terriglobia bacterium]
LDDGTMVVVDNARRMISRTIDITVTSVLQTTAGKMIFGRYEEARHYDRDRPTAAHNTSAVPPRRQPNPGPPRPGRYQTMGGPGSRGPETEE